MKVNVSYAEKLYRIVGKLSSYATLSLAIFLISGGLAYTYALGGGVVQVKDMAFLLSTPYFMFAVVLGFVGMYLLSGFSEKPEAKYAKLNYWLGVGFVFLCMFMAELLFYQATVQP